jgi:hypothetical protein
MTVMFIGSNPGVVMYDCSNVPIVFATLWIADWTVIGAGTCILIADRNGWRSFGEVPALATHLAGDFTRYFPEAASFPWTGDLPYRHEAITIEFDLQAGLRATSKSVSLTIGDILDRRRNGTAAFPLGERTAMLSNVYVPRRTASIVEHGVTIPGEPRVTVDDAGTHSSAYLAVAEVWERS